MINLLKKEYIMKKWESLAELVNKNKELFLFNNTLSMAGVTSGYVRELTAADYDRADIDEGLRKKIDQFNDLRKVIIEEFKYNRSVVKTSIEIGIKECFSEFEVKNSNGFYSLPISAYPNEKYFIAGIDYLRLRDDGTYVGTVDLTPDRKCYFSQLFSVSKEGTVTFEEDVDL